MHCKTLNILRHLLLLGAAFIALCLSGLVQATEVIPPDFKTMVHRAEIIFQGRVTNIRSEWSGEGNQRSIVTYVTFDVTRTLKGKPSSTYVLQMLGGTVDGQAMEIDGVPKFQVGDRTLLFVEHNGTQFFPVVGIMHGYFRVQADPQTGNDIVFKYNGQPLQSTAEIDQDHEQAISPARSTAAAAPATGGPMKISDFEAEIQRKAASNP